MEERKNEFILEKDKDKLLTKSDALTIFSTKEDLGNAKIDIIKWVFAMFFALMLAVVGLYFKH